MKLKWQNCWERVRSANHTEWFFNFLSQRSRWIIFLSFLTAITFCGYVWYSYVYKSNWSSEQKKSYMDSKEKGVALDKTKFDDIISNQENRKSEYEKKIENIQDIFRLGERTVK